MNDDPEEIVRARRPAEERFARLALSRLRERSACDLQFIREALAADSAPRLVWRIEEAPEELRALSVAGDDWVIAIPPHASIYDSWIQAYSYQTSREHDLGGGLWAVYLGH